MMLLNIVQWKQKEKKKNDMAGRHSHLFVVLNNYTCIYIRLVHTLGVDTYRDSPEVCRTMTDSTLEIYNCSFRFISTLPIGGFEIVKEGFGFFFSFSCAGFFKRSVRRNRVYHCKNRNKCIVDKYRRNQCRACRYRAYSFLSFDFILSLLRSMSRCGYE